jgi:hypothetical protein
MEFSRFPVWHQALVRPGWRILAKNIETEEEFDLGFVDAEAENPALEDAFLPDGDYEISVLTSALFWQDCMDRTIRTISVRPGGEVLIFSNKIERRACVWGLKTGPSVGRPYSIFFLKVYIVITKAVGWVSPQTRRAVFGTILHKGSNWIFRKVIRPSPLPRARVIIPLHVVRGGEGNNYWLVKRTFSYRLLYSIPISTHGV